MPVIGNRIGIPQNAGPGGGTPEPENLIVNGGFDTATDWVVQSGWLITGGKGVHNGGAGRLYQAYSGLNIGETYRFSATIDTTADGSLANTAMSFRAAEGGPDLANLISSRGEIVASSINNLELDWVADRTSLIFHFYSADFISVDDVSVIELP